MGDHRGRLTAAFASLAIATSALGFVAPPAAAAPTTIIDAPLSPAPTPSVSEAPTVATPESVTAGTPELAPTQPVARSQEAAARSGEEATAPSPAVKLQAEATAGGPGTTNLSSLFNELSFEPEDASSAYDPALFEHWIDADGNGCDTREEVLAAESQITVSYGNGCTITAGQWYSWYDGATWTNPSDVEIDHLVPLQEAWHSGAYRWAPELRKAYANDLGYLHSLEAVTDEVKQSKGGQDPTTWMPYLEPCRYITDWVSVKWRWNLTVDNSERDALNSAISYNRCESDIVVRPTKMETNVDTFEGWPLYKIVYDSTIYELVTQQDGSTQIAVPLSYERWANYYKFKTPAPASTDFVKYPWSDTVYAVTFWPGGENFWQWTQISFQQWQTAGYPTPRNAGWIKGSYYYKWGSSSEIFVEGADGVNHKLTGAEWALSGYRSYVDRTNEGFLKLTWANEFARMSDLGTGAGRPVGYNEWQEEAFPTPRAMQRIPGDTFYRDCSSTTIWYAGPGMNRPVNLQEWQGAGSPSPAVTGSCASTTPPSSGGVTTPPSSGGGSYTYGVTPGAFCSTAGALGFSSSGTLLTCKSSASDSRLRWRQ
jgi:hypothetical protein